MTTSCNYLPAAFQCTQEALGIDRILPATDFPYEDPQVSEHLPRRSRQGMFGDEPLSFLLNLRTEVSPSRPVETALSLINPLHLAVIDGETVITGSFNLRKAAEENNTENLLVIHDQKLAERYIMNWQEHSRHSEVYAGRGK